MPKKIKGPLFGVPVIRIIVVLGLSLRLQGFKDFGFRGLGI